jgi:hypothetical protein
MTAVHPNGRPYALTLDPDVTIGTAGRGIGVTPNSIQQ